jgi:hypothetical protein
MLLNVILKTHAWAASRPKHEAAREGRKLEEEISQIMDTEREQGMCSPTPSATPSSLSSSSFGARVIGMQLLLVCACICSGCPLDLYASSGHSDSHAMTCFFTRTNTLEARRVCAEDESRVGWAHGRSLALFLAETAIAQSLVLLLNLVLVELSLYLHELAPMISIESRALRVRRAKVHHSLAPEIEAGADFCFGENLLWSSRMALSWDLS